MSQRQTTYYINVIELKLVLSIYTLFNIGGGGRGPQDFIQTRNILRLNISSLYTFMWAFVSISSYKLLTLYKVY